MYYVSWNKYVNKPSPDLDMRPLKPFNLPSPFEFPVRSKQQSRNNSKATNNSPSKPSEKPSNNPSTSTAIIPQPTISKPLPAAKQTQSVPAPAAASRTFHLFSLLPTELRLKIWEHYHQKTPPQLLDFLLCPADWYHVEHKRRPCFAHPHILVLRPRSIPKILHICAEAREVGLGYYQLGFKVLQDGEGCSHEVRKGRKMVQEAGKGNKNKNKSREARESERDIYYDPSKDIINLEQGWASPSSIAYTWGSISIPLSIKNPEIRFQNIKHLTLTYRTFRALACTVKGAVVFEGLESVFVLGKWGGNGNRLAVGERERSRAKYREVFERKVGSWCDSVGVRRIGVQVRMVEDWREFQKELKAL